MPKKIHILLILCCGLIFAAMDGYAQNNLFEDETISLYAKACEPVRAGESRSGARVRATDKASFKSIENISELTDLRSQMSSHDFNVLVYNLVDNYLEDMAIRTLEQSQEQICVEVTGYLSPFNINKAKNNLSEKQTQQNQEGREQNSDELFLDLETNSDELPEIVTQLPPKPSPKISEEIAYDNTDTNSDALLTKDDADDEIIVFVEKTKFYNGSETGGFFSDIKNALRENPDIKATTSKTNADYILETNVLRAKVDPINNKTYRLQMVVQLELTDVATTSVITEHQNRFILFESSDDEQKVASNLMQKLLEKGCRRLLPKIKNLKSSSQKQTSSVITPVKSQVQVN